MVGGFLRMDLSHNEKRRASGDNAGCSFAYMVVQMQSTGTVRIIAPS